MALDKVLVTGASGFIAKHVVVELLRSGFVVRGSVRSASRADEVRAAVRAAGEDPSLCEFIEADLGSGAGWDQAAAGCRFVLHTASPFPLFRGGGDRALVETARGGTDVVLRAAAREGVERAVVTSSIAAVVYGHSPLRREPFGEGDFTNLQSRAVSAYARSKTIAELHAWEVARETGLAISTINPGLVLGPLLDARMGSSAKIIHLMLSGRIPLLPDLTFPAVDVRDVARGHALALTVPDVGRRFILAAPEALSLPEMADVLADTFPERRKAIPRRRLPSFALRAAGLVSSGAAMLAADTDRPKRLDTRPAQDSLGLRFIPVREALVALGHSLLRHRCI